MVDVDKILTGLTRGRTEVGARGFFGDGNEDFDDLDASDISTIIKIGTDDGDAMPFLADGDLWYRYFLPVEDADLSTRDDELKEYTQRQAGWVKANSVQVGTKVKVVRDWCNGELGFFTGQGDVTLGEYVVSSIESEEIKAKRAGSSNTWYLPYFVLEVVEDEVEEEYYVRQAKWVKANSLEVGDTVKVLQTACSRAGGWGDAWVTGMNMYVGESAEVESIRTDGNGIRLRRGFAEYNFPYFVLEVEKKKSFKERQADWVRANDIAVGSEVRVMRKAESEENGWDDSWTSHMDAAVGNVCEVTAIKSNGGILLDIGRMLPYAFPYFVLEKVGETEYRAFTDEELRDQLGKVIVCKKGDERHLLTSYEDGELHINGCRTMDAEELLEECTFIDGSVCGVKE